MTFYAFPKLDARKISSSNMLEWLNKEFRRRSKVVTVFPSMGAYLRLLTTYVMEYTEDWQKMGRAYLDLSSLQKYVRYGLLELDFQFLRTFLDTTFLSKRRRFYLNTIAFQFFHGVPHVSSSSSSSQENNVKSLPALARSTCRASNIRLPAG